MATYIKPAADETGEETDLSSYVVNIIEEVITPIQVRAKSPDHAAEEAEAVYGDNEFDPEAESLKVDTNHTIHTEHVGTEVVARDGHSLDQSVRLETKIRLFCAGRGIDSEDRPSFCTSRASIALEAFATLQGDDEEGATVTDLLSDLMHLCDKRGLTFDDLLDTARSNYEEERAEAGARNNTSG